MDSNTEQLGIRTTMATKTQFEAVEGSTSHEKLEKILEAYISLKNVPQSDVMANTIELLDMLKVNLAHLEAKVKEEDAEKKIKNLSDEIENLKKENQLIKGKYHQLNREYGDLVLRAELKGIKI